jgi:hypothetical protein
MFIMIVTIVCQVLHCHQYLLHVPLQVGHFLLPTICSVAPHMHMLQSYCSLNLAMNAGAGIPIVQSVMGWCAMVDTVVPNELTEK